MRRGGSASIDLLRKVYNAGGACWLEPAAVVGHLFRQRFPYEMHFRDVAYNKLRTAFVHFSEPVFRRFWERTAGDPGQAEARQKFAEHQEELERRRAIRLACSRRRPDWFVERFLPELTALRPPVPR